VAQNRLIALVLAMIVIVPLVATPADASMHGVAALAFEGFAIVLLATLLWRSRLTVSRHNVSAFLRTGANLPVLLFLAWAVLSCALSPLKGYSVQETLRLGAGILLYFVVAYQFRRSEHLSKLVDVLLFVGAATALVAFAQYAAGDSYRVGGTFGNPQLLASFLMILLPTVAVVALTEKSTNRQLVAQVTAVLMAAGLLLTQTRSGWLGASAALATLCGLSLFAARRTGANLAARKHELVLPAMLLVASVGTFIAFWPQNGLLTSRASTLSNVSAVNTWQSRQLQWRGALEMIKNRPLMGYGVGVFPYVQSRYTGIGMDYANGSFSRRASLTEQAHSFWLQLAAELGIPGLLLMASVLVAFMVSGFRRLRTMDAGIRRTLLMGSMAAAVGFAVDAISSPSWQMGQTSMFLWLSLGLGVSCLRPLSRREEATEAAAITVAPRVLRPAGVLATLALCAFLPTIVFAADGNSYALTVDPSSASIKGGKVLAYKVMLGAEDVTASCSFVAVPAGVGTGPRGYFVNNKYVSRWKENWDYNVIVTHGTEGATATLHVSWP